MNIQCLFFSFWLTSLCMTDSRSVYDSTNDPVSFHFTAEEYSIVYMYHIFFIRSSVNGRLGCFQVLAMVNSAAVITGVHVSFWIMVFSGYMLSSGIAGSCSISVFSFLRKLYTVLHCGCINVQSHQQCKRANSSVFSPLRMETKLRDIFQKSGPVLITIAKVVKE